MRDMRSISYHTINSGCPFPFAAEVAYPEPFGKLRARLCWSSLPERAKRAEELILNLPKKMFNLVVLTTKLNSEKIGWPTIGRVGEKASNSAWLIAQHADDISFQEKCLKLMKEAPQKEVIKRDLAYLEDRILVKKNKKQIYGTQFDSNVEKGILDFFLIKDRRSCNKRRGGIGLESLEESFAIMKKASRWLFEKKTKKIIPLRR